MLPPIDFKRWIEDNRHLLKPPVGNKCIVDGDFIVMVVGGPNARTDYHYEEGPEFFCQLEGEMVLKVQENGQARDIPIRAGEVFYLPPKLPHSPQRMPNSIGLVIERKRLPHEKDGLMWRSVSRRKPVNAVKRIGDALDQDHAFEALRPAHRTASLIGAAVLPGRVALSRPRGARVAQYPGHARLAGTRGSRRGPSVAGAPARDVPTVAA